MPANFFNKHSTLPLIGIFGVTAIGLLTVASESNTIEQTEQKFAKINRKELPRDFGTIYKKFEIVSLDGKEIHKVRTVYVRNCLRWVWLNQSAKILHEEDRRPNSNYYDIRIKSTKPTLLYYQEYGCR